MNRLMKVYRLLTLFTISVIMLSCASEAREDSAKYSASSEQKEYELMEETEINEALENSSSSKKEASKIISSQRLWRKKAKQQLETIQDLAIILKDSTLDQDFKIEIEKELENLYPNIQSLTLTQKNGQVLNFKRFKYTQVMDTLIVEFKNSKEVLFAKFTLENKTKQFGETVRKIEQLKIVDIQKK